MIIPIHIPEMFNQHDITQLESYIINLLKLQGIEVHIPKKHYYLEEVGQWLYQNQREDLALYLLPLVDKILRGNTKYLNGMPYEDAFQSLTTYLIHKLATYDPLKGRLFTYATLHIQFQLKTITSIHYKKSNDLTSLSNLEISYSDNGSSVLMEFIQFLDKLQNDSKIEYSHQLVYSCLYDLILKEKNLHPLTANPVYVISKKLGLKKNNTIVPEALEELRISFGTFNFHNKQQIYHTNVDNSEL